MSQQKCFGQPYPIKNEDAKHYPPGPPWRICWPWGQLKSCRRNNPITVRPQKGDKNSPNLGKDWSSRGEMASDFCLIRLILDVASHPPKSRVFFALFDSVRALPLVKRAVPKGGQVVRCFCWRNMTQGWGRPLSRYFFPRRPPSLCRQRSPPQSTYAKRPTLLPHRGPG